MKTATIDKVDFFDTPDSYAVVAHIKTTPELIDGHERLTLLPHIQTFSEYKPHMTLAYVNKDADVKKWVKALGKVYNGKKLKITGVNYGDLPPKTKALTSKKLDPKTQKTDVNILKDVIREHMSDQIDDAITKTKAFGAEPKHIASFSLDLERTIIPMLIKEGVIARSEVAEILTAASLYEESLPEFKLTHEQETWYQDYLDKIATSFVEETGNSIRQALQISVDQGETTTEIRKRLRNILKTDEWRVERLAKSEINRMGGRASVYATENIQTQTGIKFVKVWNTSSAEPCEFCTNLKGTKVPVDDTFAEVGGEIEGHDGGLLINDFVSMETAQAHPNCNCYTTYEVVR